MKNLERNPTLSALKKQVCWKDLRHYRPYEIIKELTLPIPWFVIALAASTQFFQESILWLTVVLIASFYFFLTCLRLAHNAFHYCLGLSKRMTDMVMLVVSVLMLGSLHATQFTHLRHHRYCLKEEDVEGHVAKQSFWRVLLTGFMFPLKIHSVALRESAGRQRKWIIAELSLNLIWLLCVWLWWDNDALKLHTILMLVAYSLAAFFAVWTVHHDCHDQTHWDNARTLRSQWKSYLFYNMFYHIEHHLFPHVPTCHLPELAKRLDIAGYQSHKWVF